MLVVAAGAQARRDGLDRLLFLGANCSLFQNLKCPLPVVTMPFTGHGSVSLPAVNPSESAQITRPSQMKPFGRKFWRRLPGAHHWDGRSSPGDAAGTDGGGGGGGGAAADESWKARRGRGGLSS